MSWRTPRGNEKGFCSTAFCLRSSFPRKREGLLPVPESAWIPACAGMTETAAQRFFCRECGTDIFRGVRQ